MLQLTNKEEKTLQKQIQPQKNKAVETKYNTKNSQYCSLGHKLNYVYWRSHVEKRLGKIQGLYFCPKCQKLFKMSLTEIKNDGCF